MGFILQRHISVFFLLLGLSPNGFRAQQPYEQVEVISVEQGLASNYLTVPCQDHQGFLWIGTIGGLGRYDGHKLKTYRSLPGDSTTLPSNVVTTLHVDRQGGLWVGTIMGLCQYNPLDESFTQYLAKPDDPKRLSYQVINYIHEDRQGQLWIGTSGGGLNLFDRNTKTFSRYYPEGVVPNPQNPVVITEFCEDRQQEHLLWMAAWVAGVPGLYSFDTQRKTFKRYDMGNWRHGEIHAVVEDHSGQLWLATEQGVVLFDKTSQKFKFFDQDPQAPKGLIISTMEDREGMMWVCSFGSGLYRYDPRRGRFEQFRHDPTNPKSISNDHVHSILEDRSGVLWITTNGGGICRWRPDEKRFYALQGDPSNPRFATGGIVTALCEDREGRLWIGSNWKGLDCYNRKTGRFEALDFTTGDIRRAATWVLSLLEDRAGRIWLGASGRGGLFCLDPARRSFVQYLSDPANPSSLGNNKIRAICEDRAGAIWLGTPDGLDRFDPNTQQFTHFRHDDANASSLPGHTVNAVFEDRSGNLWVGTERGLSRLDRSTGAFRHYLDKDVLQESLRGVQVICLAEDRAGNIWVGTGRGLFRLHFARGLDQAPQIEYYSEDKGLISNVISGVLEDKQGRLWISSIKGLTMFRNPQHSATEQALFHHYGLRDGLQGFFEERSYFMNQRGEMFFGGENGCNFFHPDSIRDNPHLPKVVFTRFEKFDTDHPDEGATEVKGVAAREKIVLSYKNNIFTISFAALDFRDPEKNRYAYQLEGFSENWVQLGNQRQVTFTNLDPGTYIFRVKGTNNDGVWNEQAATLTIVIRPPWYRSWLAYFIYLLLFAAATYTFYQYQLRRRLVQAESERLKSLDEFKSRFFTNITHEFRTPLTVILGTAEQLAETENRQPEMLKNGLGAIRRSGQNLLRLINQILDLAKLESNTLKLNYVQGDILAYLRYIVESLHTLANTQNILLRVESEEAKIMMDYDPERVLQIAHNLISNAIKFTPSGGKVTLGVRVDAHTGRSQGAQPDQLILSVTDNGVGIPPEALPFLFERFFQVKNPAPTSRAGQNLGGTGIGLSLTRELVRAMGGNISVQSPAPGAGQGTMFSVSLPITHHAPLADAVFEIKKDLPSANEIGKTAPIPSAGETGKASLLVVEDNPDVVEYLNLCLQEHYQLDFAYNGQAGIEKALETIPDLIISDVMMPGKDGFEVCDTLKNNELSSHIPLVLLTAKADMESRIAGLRRGADAYLAKPFHKEEMLLTLKNLLDQRSRLQVRFAGGAMLAATAPLSVATDLAMEDAFVQKVRSAIEDHLSDARFSVEDLCRALAVSQPQLHRKLTAVTGKNATLFVRQIRLDKAKVLLQQKNTTVSEVAYAVGFDDPKYFSRVFAETFGVPPSSFLGT